jgi:DNA-binding MarR family transcriptional regulator
MTEPTMSEDPIELSESQRKFIEKLGFYYEGYGVPRIGGRILGLLLVAGEPISAEQMARVLRVSRSSISTNIRLLVSYGMVDLHQKPQDRSDYYVIGEHIWQNAIRARVDGYHELSRLVALGAADSRPNPQLEEMDRWARLMAERHEEILGEWKQAIL